MFEFEILFQLNMSNLQYIFIGSDNGLVPNKREAIIWTNDV